MAEGHIWDNDRKVMELDELRMEQIDKIVRSLYIGINRENQDPVHGIAEMSRILETFQIFFPIEEEFEYACDLMSEYLVGDRVCE